MTTDPGPYNLNSTPVVTGPDGRATPRPMTPDFYAALDRDFDNFAGHTLVSMHSFAESWGMWEMHPKGDEIVTLITGDIDFVLWTGAGEQVLRVVEPGAYVVVPRGTWHTARPRRPSTLLFVTPGEDTQHAEAPPKQN